MSYQFSIYDPVGFVLQSKDQEAQAALDDLISAFRLEADRVFRQHRINPCCPACHQERFVIDPESPFTSDQVLKSMEDTIMSLDPNLVPNKEPQATYLYSVAAVLAQLGRRVPRSFREIRECLSCGLVQKFRISSPLGQGLLKLRMNFVNQARSIAHRLASLQYPSAEVKA